MRDSEIEQRILLEIRSGNGRDAREICVFSSNGIVTIHGTVRTRQSKAAIQQAAGRAEAVVAVINHLRVASGASKMPRTTTRQVWRGANAFLHPPIRKVATKGATRA
jgi:osmotically-inducible protein OsmY